jgi:AcrR family transcriptional regulator
LVDVARRLFATQGYWGTSLDDVVVESGFTQGAIYHHFGNKRGLFVAVFEAVDRELKAPVIRDAQNGAELWLQFVDDHRYAKLDGDQWDIYVEGLCRTVERAATEGDERPILYRDGPSVLGWEDWRRLRNHAWGQAFHEAAVTSAASAGLIHCESPVLLAQMLYTLLEELVIDVGRESNPSHSLKGRVAELRNLTQSLRVRTDKGR